MADSNSLVNIISKIRPNEIYNLGAQSHVGHSFEIPEYTSEVSGLGTLRVLEAMRFLKLKKTKFYQASTSELFGEIDKRMNMFDENSKWYLNLHMVSLNYTLIGLQKFIEKHMVFIHAMVFCLIMKVQEEEKLLSQEKLQCTLQKNF